MDRKFDIYPIQKKETVVSVYINGIQTQAVEGETVLATLSAHGMTTNYLNEHKNLASAFCTMGMCFLCLVEIDGKSKCRSCQVLVEDGMKINTYNNVKEDNIAYALHGLENRWEQ